MQYFRKWNECKAEARMCTWHFWKCNDCKAEYLHHHINQITQLEQFPLSCYIRHPRNPPNRKTQIARYLAIQNQIDMDISVQFEFVPRNLSFLIWWISDVWHSSSLEIYTAQAPDNTRFLLYRFSVIQKAFEFWVQVRIKPKVNFVIDHASDKVRFVLSRLSFFSQKNMMYTASLSWDLYVCVCVRGCVRNIYGNETSVKISISTS